MTQSLFPPEGWGGAKLLGSIAYDPAGAVQRGGAPVAMTVFDALNASIDINAPASGKIRTCLSAWVSFTNLLGYFNGHLGVMDIGGAQNVLRQRLAVGSRRHADSSSQSTPFGERLEAGGIISGLTPGSYYGLAMAFGVENSGFSNGFSYGGPNDATANNAYGALIFEVWEVLT